MRMKPFMNDVNSLEGNTEAAREEHRRGKDRRAPRADRARCRRRMRAKMNFHQEVSMSETVIRALPNGPYRVTGPAKIIDPQGNEIVIEEGRTVSLCRCGGSVNKPFCDGTHTRIGFAAAEAAVQKSDKKV
jgi:CDGSH-type Zn-finger protein